MSHQFNPTILREYDIRGIVGSTLTEADAYALGRTYAALASDEGARRIAVGRDGRTHSGMLEAALVRGLTDGGIDVVLTGMGPSPMLYFATYYLDVEVDIREAYVDRLLEGFSGNAFRIGWDAGNGAAGPILDMLVERLPGQHHVIFSDVDGHFPNHHPDP